MPAPRARLLPPLTLLVLLACRPPDGRAQEGPPAAARTDLAGDPLPAGALARMGTVRLREKGVVRLVALSPDGNLLASLSEAPGVRFWDADTGKQVDSLGGQHYTSLAFSPDGNLLATGDSGTGVRMWDAATRRELASFWGYSYEGRRRGEVDPKNPGQIRTVAFSADCKTLVAGSTRGLVRAWDTATRKEVRASGRRLDGEAVAFSPDGKTVAAWDKGNRRIQVAATDGGDPPRPLGGRQSPYTVAAFSPDGKLVAAEESDDALLLTDAATGRPVRQLPASPGSVRALAFSADGRLLAAGGRRGIHVWDLATGKPLRQITTDHGGLASLSFSADGKRLASGGFDGVLRLWDVAAGKELCPTAGHQSGADAVVYSADGKRLLSYGSDRTVRTWDAATGKELRSLAGPKGAFAGLVLGPQGKVLASWQDAGPVRLLDAAGKEVGKLDARRSEQPSCWVSFSADGGTVAVWEMGPSVGLWDARTGRELSRLGLSHEAMSATFSPAGDVVATTDRGHTIRLWRLSTGVELRQLKGHPSEVWRTAFAPDGRGLVSLGNDSTIRYWEVATGGERWSHRWSADAAAFSPDGRTLATAYHTVLYLWDTATGARLGELKGHTNWVRSLAFSPDGKALASASADTTLLVWDVAAVTGRPHPTGPDLTPAALEALWADLASADAAKGHRAVGALAAVPGQAVPFLRERLRPAAKEPEPVARLVADLGSDRFTLRAKATAALEGLGEAAEPALRRLLAGGPPLEVRRRAERLLERVDRAVPSPELLRALRAADALERVGTPAAREVLIALARGEAEARLTREARAALDRMPRRGP